MLLTGIGLQIEASKRYCKTVDIPFRLTNISLGSKFKDGEKATVIVKVGQDEFTLCTLVAGTINQHSMNIEFEFGEEISFSVNAPELSDKIHLTGNYIEDSFDDEDQNLSDIDEFDEDLSDECGSCSSGEDDDELRGSDDSDEDNSSMDEDDATGFFEDENDDSDEMSAEELPPVSTKPVSKKNEPKEESNKKQANAKGNQKQPEASQPASNKRKNEDSESTGKKQKQPETDKKQTSSQQTDKPAESKIKKLPNGLIIEDISIGSGATLEKGNKAAIYYTGKLQNGKIFDSKTSGKPFIFTIGKREVIPGMEMGIVGMNASGKRKITIPPTLGYGNKKISGIPPNSTLIFEITALEPK